MEYKIGDIIKRSYWVTWGIVVDTRPGEVKLKGHVKNHPEMALWYDVDAFDWEKQEPKVAKIGDEVCVPWSATKGETYRVDEIAPNEQVRLRHSISGVVAFGWYDLKEQPTWSINGVPCPEFFGNAAEKQPASPSVDVPKRKKRVYNA